MSAVLKQGIWTPEKRLKQSAKLRARKIRLKSSGPRTPEGKAKSSMNARKEGYEDRQNAKRVKNYVRLNRLFVSIYMTQRAQWPALKPQERLAVLLNLSHLKNELRLLSEKIVNDLSKPDNIIPFPKTVPS